MTTDDRLKGESDRCQCFASAGEGIVNLENEVASEYKVDQLKFRPKRPEKSLILTMLSLKSWRRWKRRKENLHYRKVSE